MSAQDKASKPANGSKGEKTVMDETDPHVSAADARADFEAQIATLRDELAKVKAQLASSGERSAAAARKAAASGAEHLRAQGEAAVADLRSGAGDLEAQLAEAVREKPMTSLAIAAGLGFVFALLTRR